MRVAVEIGQVERFEISCDVKWKAQLIRSLMTRHKNDIGNECLQGIN